MPRSPKMTGISVNEGKKTFKRPFQKPRFYNALKHLLTNISLNDGFTEINLRTPKSLTEILGQSSVSLKRPGILILKSADGEVCDIRGIKVSLFGALDNHLRRRRKAIRKLFVKMVCVPTQYRSGIQFLVDRLYERYLTEQINRKDAEYIERMMEKNKTPSLKKLHFRRAFVKKSGSRIFSQRQYGSKPGIYLIMKGPQLVYTGMSLSCIYRRCAVHFRDKTPWINGHSGKHVQFDPNDGEYRVCLIDFPREIKRSAEIIRKIEKLESWLIEVLDPSQNGGEDPIEFAALSKEEGVAVVTELTESWKDGIDEVTEDYPF